MRKREGNEIYWVSTKHLWGKLVTKITTIILYATHKNSFQTFFSVKKQASSSQPIQLNENVLKKGEIFGTILARTDPAKRSHFGTTKAETACHDYEA